jgi:hypothetical protein
MGHISVSRDGIPSSAVFVVDATSLKFKSTKISTPPRCFHNAYRMRLAYKRLV